MGPPGAALNSVALPLLVLGLPVVCSHARCSPWPLDDVTLPALQDLFRVDAFVVTLGWFLLHAVLYFAVPGPVVEGTPIAKLGGARLKYNCNGARGLTEGTYLWLGSGRRGARADPLALWCPCCGRVQTMHCMFVRLCAQGGGCGPSGSGRASGYRVSGWAGFRGRVASRQSAHHPPSHRAHAPLPPPPLLYPHTRP
jgi:hypothetical protein